LKRRDRVNFLLRKLPELYPDARCMLDYSGPEHLLIATILAAQTTDEAVNRVTPVLFREYPALDRLAAAEPTSVESIIHSLGFFRSKSKSIIGAARHISGLDGFPDNMEDLLKVPGVGRKTANVVLGECFGAAAIIVDTHVKRLSDRLDLTRETNPDRIEIELKKLIPPPSQTSFSHQLGFHGRRLCKAKTPMCPRCPFVSFCPGAVGTI